MGNMMMMMSSILPLQCLQRTKLALPGDKLPLGRLVLAQHLDAHQQKRQHTICDFSGKCLPVHKNMSYNIHPGLECIA
jgi:hypothetical protein